jgi:hypothetical protein
MSVRFCMIPYISRESLKLTVPMLPYNAHSLILVHHLPEHVRRRPVSSPQPGRHIRLSIRLTNIVQEHWRTGLVRIGGHPEAVVVGAVRRSFLAEVIERQFDVLRDDGLCLGGGRGEERSHDLGGVHGGAIRVEAAFSLGEQCQWCSQTEVVIACGSPV